MPFPSNTATAHGASLHGGTAFEPTTEGAPTGLVRGSPTLSRAAEWLSCPARPLADQQARQSEGPKGFGRLVGGDGLVVALLRGPQVAYSFGQARRGPG